MGRKTKIETLGTQAEIIAHQMRADGKSYRKIATELEERFNEDISHVAVKNYLADRSDERLAELGAKNVQELEKKHVEKILDVGAQLKKTNKKLNKAIDTIDETDRQDMGLLIQLSKRIEQQLKFHKEFMEEVMRPDKIEQNITQNNTTNISITEINQYLHDLEDDGIIEIKDPDKLSKMKL